MRSGSPAIRLHALLDELQAEIGSVPDAELGRQLIGLRRGVDRLESISSELLQRFDRTREYASEGAPSAVLWLRYRCRITGAAAAQRVGIARSLAELPETAAAFAKADIGYQHVAHIARTAEAVGCAAVRGAEPILVKAAKELGPGQFRLVTWHLRHALDQDGALKEANELHERRHLHLSESMGGLFYIDGVLDSEGGALLRTALEALSGPLPDEARSAKQRRADALVDLARSALERGEVQHIGGVRPHVTVTTSRETLAGLAGQPGADTEWGLPMPSETIRRLACDATIRLAVRDEDGTVLDLGRAVRTIPPALRRAAAMRDKHCGFPGCDRPVGWTQGHHIRHWIDGGHTKLNNMVLLCAFHHRLVHEGGWQIFWGEEGDPVAIPPERYRRKLSPLSAAAVDLPAS
jgi:hypothetical protein